MVFVFNFRVMTMILDSLFIGSRFIRPLDNIIATKAISASFISRLSDEILTEDRLLQMTTMWQPYQIANIAMLFTICLYMFMNSDSVARDSRWKDIPVYNNSKKITEFILIFGIILLTRDVENAI